MSVKDAREGSEFWAGWLREVAADRDLDPEAEIVRLTAELQAAQGVIAEVRAIFEKAKGNPASKLGLVLSRADTSAHDTAVLKAQAEALRRAAAAIPEKMRMDELALHQLNYALQLPEASRVMLNGATRFAERLVERAALMEQKAGE